MCAILKGGRKITVINKNRGGRGKDKSVERRNIRSNRNIIKQFKISFFFFFKVVIKKITPKIIAAEEDKYKLIAHQPHAKHRVISQSSSTQHPIWDACAVPVSPRWLSCH